MKSAVHIDSTRRSAWRSPIWMTFAIPLSVGFAEELPNTSDPAPHLKQNVAATVSDINRLAEQKLNFPKDLLNELIQGLDSAPSVFDVTLKKGQAELKRLNSRESLTGDLEACSVLLKRRKADMQQLLNSRSFGEAANAQISKISDIEKQIEVEKAGLSTSVRRVEAVMRDVSDWQKLYTESVPTMGRAQTVAMIREFVERAAKSNQNNRSN